MSASESVRNWLGRWARKNGVVPQNRSLPRNPTLEALEERAVPTVYLVNTTRDGVDTDGLITLREAVLAANTGKPVGDAPAGTGVDTIQFDVSLAGEAIPLQLTGDSSFGPSALAVTRTLTVNGLPVGALKSVTITNDSGFGDRRLFLVGSAATLNLKDVIISGGVAVGATGFQGTNGGGGGGGGAGMGGAIFNQGNLTVSGSTFSENQAIGGHGGDGGLNPSPNASALGGNGGGVFAGTGGSPNVAGKPGGFGSGGGGGGGRGATATGGGGFSSTNGIGGGAGGGPASVQNTDPDFGGRQVVYGGRGGAGSTTQGGAGGGGAGMGGAIFNFGGSVSIANSTFGKNAALKGDPGLGGINAAAGLGLGGAIFSQNGFLRIDNSTIAQNNADQGGAVFAQADGTSATAVLNSTIAAQSGGVTDVVGRILNGGNLNASGQANLIQNLDTSVFPSSIVAVSQDPQLVSLANNGGPTLTFALRPGSPAANAGVNQLFLTTDQRGIGYPRVLGGTIDIGSFELADATVPRVLSIVRSNPSAMSTNASEVTFQINFDQPVSGVLPAGFALVGTGISQASIVSVDPVGGTIPATSYRVKVKTGADGSLGLSQIQPTIILNNLGNRVSGSFTGEFFTVNRTAPTVIGINPIDANPTNSKTLHFMVVFSKDVLKSTIGVNNFGLDLSGVNATISSVAPNNPSDTASSAYIVTVQVTSGSGRVALNLTNAAGVTDTLGNPLQGAFFSTNGYDYDATSPVVQSIIPVGGGVVSPDGSIQFEVKFSKPVNRESVTPAAFNLEFTGTLSASKGSVSGAEDTYRFRVNGLYGNGSIKVTIPNNAPIVDTLGNPLGSGGSSTVSGIVRNVPSVRSITPSVTTPTKGPDITFDVLFSNPIQSATVGAADFVLVSNGAAVGRIVSATPDNANPALFHVLVSGLAGQGRLGLDISPAAVIIDSQGTQVVGAFADGGFALVDTVGPLVNAIVPIDATPTNQTTLRFSVSFNKQLDLSTVTPAGFNLVQPQGGTWVVNQIDQDPIKNNTFIVTVKATGAIGNGNLFLVVPGNGSIKDLAGNSVASTFNQGQPYQVTSVSPAVQSISTLDANPTKASLVAYLVTFTQDVDPSTVNPEDFVLITQPLPGQTVGYAQGVVSSITGTGNQFQIYVTITDGDGRLRLEVAQGADIRNLAGQKLNTSGLMPGASYDILYQSPTVVDSFAQPPAKSGQPTVSFIVTFSQPMNPATVTAPNFKVLSEGLSGTAVVSGVTPVPGFGNTVFQVNITGYSGIGTLQMDVLGGMGAQDAVGNPLLTGLPARSVYQIDTQAATVSSIVPAKPGTNQSVMDYTITFSDPIDPTTVAANSFSISTTGTATGTIKILPQTIPSKTYVFQVENISGNGFITVNLVPNSGVKDTFGNAVEPAGYIGSPLQVISSNNKPTVTSIITTSPNPLFTSTAQFKITFSQNMDLATITPAELALIKSATLQGVITGISGSGTEFIVTVENITGQGNLQLIVPDQSTIADVAGNILATGFLGGPSYSVNTLSPVISGITQLNPAVNFTNSTSVVFRVQFGQAVNGALLLSNYIPKFTGTLSGSVTSVIVDPNDPNPAQPSIFNVTVSTTGAGTVALTVPATNAITSLAGTPFSVAFNAGQVYNIDNLVPSVLGTTPELPGPVSTTQLNYILQFSEPVLTSTVVSSALNLVIQGALTGTVGTITALNPANGNASQYKVQVTGLTGTGTVALGVVANSGIKDSFGNTLTAAFASGTPASINQVSPKGTAIVTASPVPVTGGVVSFRVLFDKPVNPLTVNPSDFDFGGDIRGAITDIQPDDGTNQTMLVTVSGLEGYGRTQLILKADATIRDFAGNLIQQTALSGPLVQVVDVAPGVLAITSEPSRTNAASIDFVIRFSQTMDLSSIKTGSFLLATTGTVSGSITAITPVGSSGDLVQVTVGNLVGQGSITLGVSNTSGIKSSVGTPLANGYDPSVSTPVQVDRLAPQVQAINLGGDVINDPTRSAGVLSFIVQFSEAVDPSTVKLSAFQLGFTGSTTGVLQSVTGTGNTYLITARSVSGAGTIKLNLLANSGIKDNFGNLVTAGFTQGQTYQIQAFTPISTPAPQINSIDISSAVPTKATSLQFVVNFNRDMVSSTVTPSAFQIVTTGGATGSISSVTGSGKTFIVTVDGVSGTGSLALQTVQNPGIFDLAGQSLPGGFTSGFAYQVDNSAPTVNKLVLLSPNPTRDNSVIFQIEFSEPVDPSTVNSSSLSLVWGTNNAQITSVIKVDAEGRLFQVQVENIEGAGELSLSAPSFGTFVVRDLAGNSIVNGFGFPGYEVDRINPLVSNISILDSNPTGSGSVRYLVTFTEVVEASTVTNDAFNLVTTGSATGVVRSVQGSGANYIVTVDTIAGAGNLSLSVPSSAQIVDLLGNALGAGFSASETYTVNRTSPSVILFQPTDNAVSLGQSIVYQLTFDRDINPATLTSSVFLVNVTGASSGTVQSVSGSGKNYLVSVAPSGGNGSVSLEIPAFSGVLDTLGNPIAQPAGSGFAAYLPVAPTVVSLNPEGSGIQGGIDPNDPTQTIRLVKFRVVFSQPMDQTSLTADSVLITNTGEAKTGFGSVIWENENTAIIALQIVNGVGSVQVTVLANGTVKDAAGNLLSSAAVSPAVLLDITPPSVEEILAKGPPFATNSGTVQFSVRFSEGMPASAIPTPNSNYATYPIQTITNGTLVAHVIAVTKDPNDPSVFLITVGGGFDTLGQAVPMSGTGTLGLNIPDGAAIFDEAGNRLNAGGTSNLKFFVDRTIPAINSIVPESSNGKAGGPDVSFLVTFNKDLPFSSVVGSNFNVAQTGLFQPGIQIDPIAQPVNPIGNEASVFRITLRQVNGIGTLKLGLNPGAVIVDALGNVLDTSAAFPSTAVEVNSTVPSVASVTLITPVPSPTNVTQLVFDLVFSDPVVVGTATQLATSDFVTIDLNGGTARGTISSVTGSGTNYQITVTSVSGTGLLSIGLAPTGHVRSTYGVPAVLGNPNPQDSANVDRVAPAVESINLVPGGSSVNGSLTNSWKVVFSKDVNASSVNPSDFRLVTTGTLVAEIVSVTGDQDTYTVTVRNVTGDGTISLLVPQGVSIFDMAGNRLAGEFTAGQVATTDRVAPRVTDITPLTPTPVNGGQLQYVVSFSKLVDPATVIPGLFALTTTGTARGQVLAAQQIPSLPFGYLVTVGEVGGNGTIRLELPSGSPIADQAGNRLENGFSATPLIEVDTLAPRAVSITGNNPSPTAATGVGFIVTFDSPIDFKTLTPDDFEVFGTGSAAGVVSSITPIDSQGRVFGIQVGGITGEGTLTLVIRPTAQIQDRAGNNIGNGFSDGFRYTVDRVAPAVSTINGVGISGQQIYTNQAVFQVTFSEIVNASTVSTADFALALSNATGTVSSVSPVVGRADQFNVTVSNITGSGTLRVDVPSNATVTDPLGNNLAGGYSLGQQYQVRTGAPTVTSFTTNLPTTQIIRTSSADFQIVFSKPVKTSTVTNSAFSLVAVGGITGTIGAPVPIDASGGLATTFRVPLIVISGSGNIGLSVVAGKIQDNFGNFLVTPSNSPLVTIDNQAPQIVGINLLDITPTAATTVRFRILFSENVIPETVLPTSFQLVTTGFTRQPVLASLVRVNDSTFDVVANGVSDTGTIGLKLLANSGISDNLGNIQNGTFTGPNIYNIRNAPSSTAPRILSITNPATGPIKASSTTFTVNFDSGVQGVSAASFNPFLSNGAAGATIGSITQVTPSQYTVVVNNLPNGSYNLRLDISANPGITNGTGQALVVPYAAGATVLVRNGAFNASTMVDSNQPTNGGVSGSVIYRLHFDNPVVVASVGGANLSANFALSQASGNPAGTVASVSAVNAVNGLATDFNVMVNNLSGTGLLRLDVKAGNVILDQVGNSSAPLSNGASYNIDKTAPSVLKIESLNGAVSASSQVSWRVTFTKPVQPETVTQNSFFLLENGLARGELASISGSGAVYQITANATEGSGSLGLAVVVPPTGTKITDLVGNTLVQESAGPNIVIDFTPPTVLGVAVNGASKVSKGAASFTLGFTKEMQASSVNAQALKLLNIDPLGQVVQATITTVDPTVGNSPLYTVGVNITGGNGHLGLDALPGRARDVGGNALIATNPNGMQFDVSGANPEVLGIIPQGPLVTRLTSLDFVVSFSKPMDPKTITPDGFEIKKTGTASGSIGSIVPLNNDSTQFRVTLFGVAGNGELSLAVRSGSQIRDQFGNPLGTATYLTGKFTIDNIAPTVKGISVVGANLTNATTVQFRVTFSEQISPDSLIPAAYQLVTTGNLIGRVALIEPVVGDPLSYTVTVDKLYGEGTVALQVLGNGLTADLAGNTFIGNPVTGPIITISNQPPRVTGIDLIGATQTNASFVRFTVNFSQAMDSSSFQNSDFQANFTGSLSGQVTSVTGGGTSFVVTVGNLSGDGTVSLTVPSTATLLDLAGNALKVGFGPSSDFRVDRIAPQITFFNSLQGYNPTTKSVPFQVTFSEVVTGFVPANITTTNGVIVNLRTIDGGKTWLFDNQTTRQGTIKVTINPIGITDTFGNALAAGATRTVSYAPPLPTVAALSVGGLPFVQVIDPTTGSSRQFQAFGTGFRGGLSVATGDVNGDGVSDIIVGVASNGAPHVKVFSGKDNTVLFSFYAFAQQFIGGVNVAAGDINADGFADIIVGSGRGAQANVRAFSGQNAGLIRSFNAYGPSFTGGVRVASGDVNGDGFADIVCGSGVGSSGHIKVQSGANGLFIQNFMAFNSGVTNGVFVASGDLNGDGLAEVVVSLDQGAIPSIKVFAGPTMGTPKQQFLAFNSAFRGGTRVAVANRPGSDGLFIVAGNGPGAASQVRYFDGRSVALVDSVFVLQNFGFTGGIDV